MEIWYSLNFRLKEKIVKNEKNSLYEYATHLNTFDILGRLIWVGYVNLTNLALQQGTKITNVVYTGWAGD